MVFLFLGFPSAWDKFLALITGLVIVIAVYKADIKEVSKISNATIPFKENISTSNQSVVKDNINSEITNNNPNQEQIGQ